MVFGLKSRRIVPVSTANDNFTLYSKTGHFSRLGGLRRRRYMSGVAPVGISSGWGVNSIGSAPIVNQGFGYGGLGTTGFSSGYYRPTLMSRFRGMIHRKPLGYSSTSFAPTSTIIPSTGYGYRSYSTW